MKTTSNEADVIIANLEKFIHFLDRNNSLVVHSKISQSYYMEKVAQLKALLHQRDVAQHRLDEVQGWLTTQIGEAALRFSQDSEWLRGQRVCKEEY